MELVSLNHSKISDMKNILSVVMITILAVAAAGCSKIYSVKDANASFVAYKLDGDKVRQDKSTSDLTVQLFKKTINGVDQNIAYVEFEFAGEGDLTSIWTGDSLNVVVPKTVDGSTGEVTAYEKLFFASDYDLYKTGDYTQRGNLLNNGDLIYTYWKAGTYKVYLIASNWGEMGSGELKRDIKMITITVVGSD
jgi:hypothetical protein